MGDVEARVAVLEDWRRDHTEEHRVMWTKHDELRKDLTTSHLDHDRRLERVETKLMIYTSMGVGVGSVLGGIISALLMKVLRVQ